MANVVAEVALLVAAVGMRVLGDVAVVAVVATAASTALTAVAGLAARVAGVEA